MKYLFETNLTFIERTGDTFVVAWSDNGRDNKYTFMDVLGQIYDEKTYFSLSERSDGYFEARPHSSITTKILIDGNGQEVYTYPASSKIKKFDNGIAILQPYNDRKYFLRENGDVLGQNFKNVHGFANGIGIVELFNDKWVAVNDKMEIISSEFDYIHPFNNYNYSWIINEKNILVINRDFNVVSSEYIDEYGNKKPYGQIYRIDENDVIISREFRFNSKERNMFSMISINGKKLGRSHLNVQKSSEGMYLVSDEDGSSFVDVNGKYITSEKFINCSDFNEGMAVVGKFDKEEIVYGFLKKDGTMLKINSSYLNKKQSLSRNWIRFAQDFQEGYGAVILGGENRHIIDKTGKVHSGAYYKLGLFSDGYAKFYTKDKKMSFIDKESLKPVKEEFDYVKTFKTGYAVVETEGKYDVIDTEFIKLSEVSKFVFEIQQNPNNITQIPKKFYCNKELVCNLFELAESIAGLLGDKELIENIEMLFKQTLIKIEDAKNIEEMIKGENW